MYRFWLVNSKNHYTVLDFLLKNLSKLLLFTIITIYQVTYNFIQTDLDMWSIVCFVYGVYKFFL